MEFEKIRAEIESYGFRRIDDIGGAVVYVNPLLSDIRICHFKGKIHFMFSRVYDDGLEIAEGVETGAFRGFMECMMYFMLEMKKVRRIRLYDPFEEKESRSLVSWVLESGFYIKPMSKYDGRYRSKRYSECDVFAETRRDSHWYRLFFNSIDMNRPLYVGVDIDFSQWFSRPVSTGVVFHTSVSQSFSGEINRHTLFTDVWKRYESRAKDSMEYILSIILVKENQHGRK